MSSALLDLSGYIKFFIGLFALVNPVGILPVFISMTNYQSNAGRNKTILLQIHQLLSFYVHHY
ncbi:MarC family protein [Providencia hangzhouensis]|uniref:MarC family protein n=1 Tax=Providencia hangzhouensis TaxID=3031799 RepID=UPI0034DD15F1